MNIEHVRAFLEVAASGSFQLAAERLHITQSTISARIKALEERMNQQLLARRRSGIQLTRAGRLFHRHALKLVSTWEQARHEVALSEDKDAMVSLGLQLHVWKALTPRWLDWMEEHAPHVATQVTADYSDHLWQQLREGLLDMAVAYDPRHSQDLHIEVFNETRLILVSTEPGKVKGDPLHNYVFVDWGRLFRDEHSKALAEKTEQRLSVGMADIGLDFILTHGGAGYFDIEVIGELIEQGVLHPVAGAPKILQPIYLVYSRSRGEEANVKTALAGLKRLR
ncbi:LysR family transcriptional regulator [Marinobacterium jannaschii]|uniref:LysR family transcriptional regulator n=1 Tax=Marinobacterium jannaschii TaxID=64970 RepID=UPI0004830FFB|nr:LysR family transcriptional regulator [Marinobacterium jannaschii]